MTIQVRIDHEYIMADSMENLYQQMNNERFSGWSTFGETLVIATCGS